jgi:hypothetical protein
MYWFLQCKFIFKIVEFLTLDQIAALYVAKSLSPLVRSMLEVLLIVVLEMTYILMPRKIGRTLGVWLLSIFTYYVLNWSGPSSAGEPFSEWSLVELLGFVLMAFAILTVFNDMTLQICPVLILLKS